MKFSNIMTEEQFNSLSEADFQEALDMMSTLNMYNKRGIIPENPVEGDMYMDNDLKVHFRIGGEWKNFG